MSAFAPTPLAALEVDLLVQAVSRAYAFDAHRLARPDVERAVDGLMHRSGARSVAALVERVLHEPAFGREAVDALCACDTRLFDNTAFYCVFNNDVVPWLRTYPYSSIWVAECGTGGAVYSIVILLQEAGLLDRTCVHATDCNPTLLAHAKQGRVPAHALARGEQKYSAVVGLGSLREHFAVHEGDAVLSEALLRKIVWSHYDLGTGHSFNEFDCIVCCETLSELPMPNRRRTLRLVGDSLSVSGLLALDPEEKPDLIASLRCYKRWSTDAQIYQRTC